MIKGISHRSLKLALLRWSCAGCLVVGWASACSGSDDAKTAREDGGEAGKSTSEAGTSNDSGGSSANPSGAGVGGQDQGEVGGASGGAGPAAGGMSVAGSDSAGGVGGAAVDDVCPNAPEPTDAGCVWKSVLACNSGVKIVDWCGEGMQPTTLERCPAGGGGLFEPDADYQELALSPCATDCEVDGEHVTWRCIECCPLQ